MFYIQGNVLIYKRYYQSEKVIVALNSKNSPVNVNHELDGDYVDYFSKGKVNVIESIPANGFYILVNE